MTLRKLTFFIMLSMAALSLHAQRFLGGDISLLPSYVEEGTKYLDYDGKEVEPLGFFKQEGWNAMRVRLFVDPENAGEEHKREGVCQDLDYVVGLSKQIKKAGFKLMLDFHYSDTWADPAKQWTPKAWKNLNDNELYQKIYEYTKDALQKMVDAGATPDFIQTGNEISYGMLWGKYGTSEASQKKCYINNVANWSRFTTLLKNAGKACREVCPQAKIILHTERAAQVDVLTNFYNQMKSASVDYDIIGLSYYPIWHKNIATLETALNTLENSFADKDIMIVETGYAYSWYPDNYDYNYQSVYPATEEGQANYTRDLITMLNKHSKVTGLFWWWMEYNAYPWSTTHMDDWWYAPLFNGNTGMAMPAFYEMKNFLGDTNGIASPSVSNQQVSDTWFNLQGQKIENPEKSGIYIKGNRKIIVK